MDYSPTPNVGEQPSMQTFHSRGLARALTLACALVAAGGAAAVIVSGSSIGTMLLVTGAIGALAGVASEIAARRRPVDATPAPFHAGPAEAGWGASARRDDARRSARASGSR